MFGRRYQPLTEKQQREHLRGNLWFCGTLAALSLVVAGYFVWQDGGFSGSFYVMLIFTAFWLVPFGFGLLNLRSIGKKSK
jgi:hypothetical protein